MEKTKEFKWKDWFIFLSFVVFSVCSFYANAIWAGLFCAIVAIIAFPNPAYQIWLRQKSNDFVIWFDQKCNAFLSAIKGILYLGFVILVIFVSIWFIGKAFGSIGGIGKYEGRTAEEWFNEYDNAEAKYQELHDCVEPLAYSDRYEDLKSIYYECL